MNAATGKLRNKETYNNRYMCYIISYKNFRQKELGFHEIGSASKSHFREIVIAVQLRFQIVVRSFLKRNICL